MPPTVEDKLEPIAIVGMSCRFPGDADSTENFWNLLSQGESAWSEVPKNRYNIHAYYHPSAEREGAVITKSGFFLKQDASKFDASFFSMTASEAAGADPQQRMLLELAYEAFENAGIPMGAVAGSATSCHIGAFGADYSLTSSSQIWDTNPYQATGLGMSVLSNRLSWFFDLRGPSMTIDTACSSSLVALHLGVQGLRNGESNMAVVGGANLIFQPETSRGMSALRFLSPDGKCHSFDASANGYGRGEGVGVLVLKRLKDALRDNDTIRAVIRASALNQDGKTPNITVPSKDAQAELIHKTYRDAGLDFGRTQYFEAHGTGTPIGDPIEVSAIRASVGAGRTPDNPLYVGSVKTNLGHLEATAGIAGIMKAVLSLEKGVIPQVVGLENVNPRLQLEDSGLMLNTQLVSWPTTGLRRASVNSFGYGGANAHVILDDARHYLAERGFRGNHSTVAANPVDSTHSDSDSGVSIASSSSRSSYKLKHKSAFCSPKLLVLSSTEQTGTARLAEAYAGYMERKKKPKPLEHDLITTEDELFQEATYIEDLAYTLGDRRSPFDWRTFAVAGTIEEFQSAINRGLPKLRRSTRAAACAYVFTGQGSQYFNMGRELQSNSVFKQSLQAADDYLVTLGSGWSALEELNKFEESSKINQPEISQPLCTILQVALVDLLQHWGIAPTAVVGHSSGEIGAAYAAGALSQEDAWKVAYFRGLYSGSLPLAHPELSGAMMAVAISEAASQQYTAKVRTGKVVVACVNSPSSITLSGDRTAVDEVEILLKEDDIWCRKLKVNTAYHSHHMEFIAEEYLRSIADIAPVPTDNSVTMFSSVTGKKVLPVDLGPSYWVENLLSPVRFSSAVTDLLAPKDARHRRQKLPSVQTLVEIGPHGVLKGPLKQILAAGIEGFENLVDYVSVLHRGNDAYETAVLSAGRLWAYGHNVKLSLVNTPSAIVKTRKVLSDLPPYPWNHERSHWHEARGSAFKRLHSGPRTDLLGFPNDNFNPLSLEHRWSNFIKPVEMPWLMDHVIQGLVVFPASAMIAMAIEACQQIADPAKTVEGYEFRDINFTRALMFPAPDKATEIAMQFRPQTLGTKASTYVWQKFHLTSITKDNSTTEHCNGLVRIKYVAKPSEIENGTESAIDVKNYRDTYEDINNRCTKEVDVPQLFADLSHEGMQYGPLFQLLSDLKGGVDIGCGTITIPDTASAMPGNYEHPLLLHPAVLDAIFQIPLSRTVGNGASLTPSVVSSVGSIYISNSLPNTPGTVLRCYQKSFMSGHRNTAADLVAADPEFSKPLVVIKSGVTTSLVTDKAIDETANNLLAIKLDWKEDVGSLSQVSAHLLSSKSKSLEHELVAHVDVLEDAAQIYIRRALSLLEPGPETNTQPSAIGWVRNYISTNGSRIPKIMSIEEEEEILKRSAEGSSLGKVMQVIGSNLKEFMTEPIDARLTLLEQGHGDPMALTDELFCTELINSMIETWFDLAGHKNPDLEILEIGSGSVSTAVSIMDILSSKNGSGTRYGYYTFTDTDSSRLDDIKALLKNFPNVNVEALDMERDLATQNFNSKKFDVIVVNEIMPSIARIEATVQNAKQLLKPGGKLVIAALSKLTSRTVLTLGLTEKWWMGHNDDTSHTMCLPVDIWTTVLSENSMSPEVSTQDFQLGDVHQLSLIVSTLPKEEVQNRQSVVLLEPLQMTPSTATLSCNIAEQLVRQSLTVTKSTIASIPDPEDKIFISLLELDSPLLESISEPDFNNLKVLVTKSAGVLWMTRGGVKGGASLPHQSVAIGLFRTILSEAPHLRIFNLDLSLTTDMASTGASTLVVNLFNTSFSPEEDAVIEHEYAEADGVIFVPRLVHEESMNSSLAGRNDAPTPEMQKLFQSGRPLKMVLGEIGLLDTFRFVEREEYKVPLLPRQVDIQIVATGLNFVDIMAALGYIPSSALGAEFAGVITEMGELVPDDKFHVGQMVVGSSEHSFASNTRVDWRSIQPVPEGVTPEAAATCFIAFVTAYFSLYDNGKLKKNDKILIHSAAGGLGQAAVQLAQHIGAVVYCTVGSLDKKQVLIERYGIPENHIFNSRDTTFAKGVMRETKGRGVDVVLNSTFGEMLRESWNCLADFGIFVEVGKRDILSNNMLEMAPFIRGCTFSAFNLAQYNEDCEPHRLEAYSEVVKKVFELLGEGSIKPLYPLHVMSITEAEKAFRALQSGKIAGKIVLKMNPDAIVPVIPEKELPVALDPEATYLLAGGLGGIGRSLSDLMVEHGARHIAFLSRSGDASDESKSYLEKLRRQAVNAVAYACDITDRGAVEGVLQDCATEMPKIRGFVHCAMMLKDTVFENMSHSDWVAATGPKIQGSWNMHELLPPDVDFFIMLSSIAGIIGNPGQANYAAGNTFQNGLAHYRRRKGLKATSIDLSAVAGVGYLAENLKAYENRGIMRIHMREDEVHYVFLAALAGTIKKDYEMPPQISTGILGGEVLRSLMPGNPWAQESKFALLRKADGRSGASLGESDPTREAFISSESLAEAAGVVEGALVARLAKALFMSPEDINTEQPLHAYGVDSLIAVEVRNWVLKELKSDISILDILSPISIASLAMNISEGSKILPVHLRVETEEAKKDEDAPALEEDEQEVKTAAISVELDSSAIPVTVDYVASKPDVVEIYLSKDDEELDIIVKAKEMP